MGTRRNTRWFDIWGIHQETSKAGLVMESTTYTKLFCATKIFHFTELPGHRAIARGRSLSFQQLKELPSAKYTLWQGLPIGGGTPPAPTCRTGGGILISGTSWAPQPGLDWLSLAEGGYKTVGGPQPLACRLGWLRPGLGWLCVLFCPSIKV